MSDDDWEDRPRYQLDMSEETADALRQRGGQLYITKDSAGLPRARTVSPEGTIPLTTISGDGWVAHVDSTINSAWWLVKWTRFPWPRFRLLPAGQPLTSNVSILDFLG